jgi:hypothetical protein
LGHLLQDDEFGAGSTAALQDFVFALCFSPGYFRSLPRVPEPGRLVRPQLILPCHPPPPHWQLASSRPPCSCLLFEPCFPWYAPAVRMAAAVPVVVRLQPPDFCISLLEVPPSTFPSPRIHHAQPHTAQVQRVLLSDAAAQVPASSLQPCSHQHVTHLRSPSK